MKTSSIVLLAVLSMPAIVRAGPRTSANYSIATDTVDSGGARATSAIYLNSGSVGGIAGIATVGAPAETLKAGYIGQLYEITALQIAATPATMNEGGTRQLAAAELLDDTTTLAVPAANVAWSVVSGPLASIGSGGLATAGPVYQNTPTSVQGVHAGFTGNMTLTVLDTLPDNFGSYAGDGLDDSWQFQYFGLNNPLAAPGLDPDGDGQSNYFEFTAGIVPTDPASRFRFRIDPVPGYPGSKDLIFSPLVAGRSYEVKSNTAITGAWQPLGTIITADAGAQRTVTDLNATGAAKFYHVEITKP